MNDIQGSDLRQQLLNSNDPDQINKLVGLFNVNLKKREVIRADIYSELQDKVTEQIGKRIENHSDTFSNKDLLDYMNAIQGILNKQSDVEIKVPQVAIQNNVTINSGGELSQESRDRIKDVVQRILKQQKQQEEQVVDGVAVEQETQRNVE